MAKNPEYIPVDPSVLGSSDRKQPMLAAFHDDKLSPEAAKQLADLYKDPTRPTHVGKDLPRITNCDLDRLIARGQAGRGPFILVDENGVEIKPKPEVFIDTSGSMKPKVSQSNYGVEIEFRPCHRPLDLTSIGLAVMKDEDIALLQQALQYCLNIGQLQDRDAFPRILMDCPDSKAVKGLLDKLEKAPISPKYKSKHIHIDHLHPREKGGWEWENAPPKPTHVTSIPVIQSYSMGAEARRNGHPMTLDHVRSCADQGKPIPDWTVWQDGWLGTGGISHLASGDSAYSMGYVARKKGHHIHYNAYDANAQRANHIAWLQGWFAVLTNADNPAMKAWVNSQFMCDQCHKLLTLDAHRPTNDHGGMVCKNGCEPKCTQCGGNKVCFMHTRGDGKCLSHPTQCKCELVRVEEITPIRSRWAHDASQLGF